jgi:hypothetical protein
MPKFRASIHGVNFRMRTGSPDKEQLLGFYTNAFVEAESPEAAESIVVDLLRADPRLREDVVNRRDDPPRLFVEEIEEIADWPPDTARPLTGLAFYDDLEVSWRQGKEGA